MGENNIEAQNILEQDAFPEKIEMQKEEENLEEHLEGKENSVNRTFSRQTINEIAENYQKNINEIEDKLGENSISEESKEMILRNEAGSEEVAEEVRARLGAMEGRVQEGENLAQEPGQDLSKEISESQKTQNQTHEKLNADLDKLFESFKSGKVNAEILKRKIEQIIDGLSLVDDQGIFADSEVREIFLEKTKGMEKLDDKAKRQIFTKIDEAFKASNEEEFKRQMLEALSPVLKNNPIIFEDVEALTTTKQEGFTLLNERISYGIGENTAHIHLSPSYKLKEKIPILFKDGLSMLAKILKDNQNVKEVVCTSWLVATKTYGSIFKELGFEIKDVPDETKERYFQDEKRPMKMAYMERDEFLRKFSAGA